MNNINGSCNSDCVIINKDRGCESFELDLKNCKHCMDLFKPKNPKTEYCSKKCSNNYNVRKHREKVRD